MLVEKRRVYIETTIPSFYFEARSEPDMLAMRHWTRDWWDNHRHRFALVTSEAVVLELERGDYAARAETVALIDNVTILGVVEPIRDTVHAYITHLLMPRDPGGDAIHLALASYYKCDFLLTWNCSHLANPNKYPHILRVNAMLGLYTPQLVTPMQLLGGEDDRERR
jgi:hypothetical protein